MSGNSKVSEENINGKNRIEFSGVSCAALSDKDDDDIILLKLEAEDKDGSDEDFDCLQKDVKNGKGKKVVPKVDLEEGEVFSEGPAEGNTERDVSKKKSTARKTKSVISKEADETPEASQENQNEPMRKVASNHIWVSNINRKVKAADLKTFFGKIGKVCTAKILTNGKYFYGYVTLENAAVASKCIRQLNNTLYEGEKIVVSKSRPDLRDAKAVPRKTETVKNKQDKSEKKKRDDVSSSDIPVVPSSKNAIDDETHSDKENDHDVISISSGKMSETKDLNDSSTVKLPTRKKGKFGDTHKRNDKYKFEKPVESRNTPRHDEQERTMSDLRKKIKLLFSENDDLKKKLDDYQRRHNGIRTRCMNTERELKKVRFENHEDRQRLSEEREMFEKKKKSELARIEADRAAVAKEIAENRKLKDQLKFRIEELKTATAKMSKRHRSPVLRNVRSPPCVRGSSSGHFRGEKPDRAEKRPRHDEVSRVRTPPSPPKFVADSARKRSSDNAQPFYAGTVKRQSPVNHQFQYKHKPLFRRSAEGSRPDWAGCFQKEPRRSNPVHTFPGDGRYGGGFPEATPNINVPLRGSHNPQYYSQW